MTKIMALVIAMVMVVGMSVTAFAADSITISVNTAGQEQEDQNTEPETYTAYKIFGVVKADDVSGNDSDDILGEGEEKGYNYTIATTDAWYSVVSTELADYLTLTPISGQANTYTVTVKDGKNTEAAAKEMAAILKANIPAGVEGDEFDHDTPLTDAEPGYYLITSSLGTGLILATTDIDITEKNEYPTIDKTIEKDTNKIGNLYTYTITVHVPETADTTKFMYVTDWMDDEITYDASRADMAAKIKDTETAVTLIDSANWTDDDADYVDEQDNGFQVKFAITSAMLGKNVVITYKAELNVDADADTEYLNTTHLNYSNYQTPDVEVDVKTFDIEIDKVDGDGTLLDGAEFELRFNSATAAAMEFIEGSSYDYIKADDDTATADKVTTLVVANGQITINGLDEVGTYYLVETKAPDGFNALKDPVIFTIEKEDGEFKTVSIDGSISEEIATSDTDTIEVVNQSGTILPSTGGMGTTIFYIVGAILVIGAGVILITRRRMRAE